MIKSIYIKNFKAFEDETILLEKNNLVIGENDSGKSSILQALDIFFNQEKIEKVFIRDLSKPVEIGILYGNSFYKKEFSPSSYKLSKVSDNCSDLDNIKYVYIPVASYDVKKVITQLATAKAIEKTDKETIKKLKEISTDAITDVISSVDQEIIVVDNKKTELEGIENFHYDKSLAFVVNSNGIPVESRGSGYQKNLMYAVLVGRDYGNVILGIDEIENSLSINNVQKILNELNIKIGQTIFTTHSKRVVGAVGNTNMTIIPLYSSNNESLYELLDELDNSDKKTYIIVEGKFDLPWYKHALALMKKTDEYIVLPGGGSSDTALKDELEKLGRKCILITDGDKKSEYSISKDCIELYIPLEDLNRLLNINLNTVPQTKQDFFKDPITDNNRKSSKVKSILSSNVIDFLKLDNSLISEINSILEKNKCN